MLLSIGAVSTLTPQAMRCPQGKALSDFVLHHTGTSGRTKWRTHSAWDGGKDQKTSEEEHTPGESLLKPTSTHRALRCSSCANILHSTGSQPLPHPMPKSTPSKASAPSPGLCWSAPEGTVPQARAEKRVPREAACQLAFASALLQSKSGTCLKSKTN